MTITTKARFKVGEKIMITGSLKQGESALHVVTSAFWQFPYDVRPATRGERLVFWLNCRSARRAAALVEAH